MLTENIEQEINAIANGTCTNVHAGNWSSFSRMMLKEKTQNHVVA
tara:strand:- start:286 stop:420 length:135 start_codon:yes stop_codon:yes gene_type:complete